MHSFWPDALFAPLDDPLFTQPAQAYYWLDSGDGTGAALSVFEDQAGADAALDLAAKFLREYLAALVGKPEIIRGEVKVYANCGL